MQKQKEYVKTIQNRGQKIIHKRIPRKIEKIQDKRPKGLIETKQCLTEKDFGDELVKGDLIPPS